VTANQLRLQQGDKENQTESVLNVRARTEVGAILGGHPSHLPTLRKRASTPKPIRRHSIGALITRNALCHKLDDTLPRTPTEKGLTAAHSLPVASAIGLTVDSIGTVTVVRQDPLSGAPLERCSTKSVQHGSAIEFPFQLKLQRRPLSNAFATKRQCPSLRRVSNRSQQPFARRY
jgi:hypothetical protein